MHLNQLEIYKNFGQFDNILTMFLDPTSKDYKEYGNSVTGFIRYNFEERVFLQKNINGNMNLDEYNKIKINTVHNNYNTKEKYDLFYEGIMLTSIINISSLQLNKTNKFIEKDLRNLDEPITLNFNPTDFDAVTAIISLNNKKRKDGYKFAEFEENQDIAYRIIANNYLTPIEYRHNKKVRFYVLEYKNLYSELNIEEELEYKEIIECNIKVSAKILMKILISESKNKLTYLNGRKDIVHILTLLVTYFKEETLILTKIHVWWNLERYLHIMLGHVSGLKFCINNKLNSEFQYDFRNIRELIIEILYNLKDEINLHFIDYPNKDFKRQGNMSFYFKGDYYIIHIRKDGLLQTIYKK